MNKDMGDPAAPSRDRAPHGAADGVSTLRASPAIAERVAVTGGRHYNDAATLWFVLDKLIGVRVLMEGASDDVTGPYVGADYWAHQWALARGIETIRFHANWKAYGRAAGPLRNRQMCDSGNPGLVVAFPGGRGTANMIALASARGIPVYDAAQGIVTLRDETRSGSVERSEIEPGPKDAPRHRLDHEEERD